MNYRQVNLEGFPFGLSSKIDAVLSGKSDIKFDKSDIEKLFLISYSKLHSDYVNESDGTFPDFFLSFNKKDEITGIELFDQTEFLPSSFKIKNFEKQFIDLLQKNLDYIVMEYYDDEDLDSSEYECSCNVLSISDEDLETLNSIEIKSAVLKSIENFDFKNENFYNKLVLFIKYAFFSK